MKKHSIIIYSLITALGLVLFAGCDKNSISLAKFDGTEGKALFKINYASPYYFNPGVQIKLNGNRVSNLVQYNTPYPGGGLNTLGSDYPNYLAIAPGSVAVSISIPKKGTNEDSVSLYSANVDVKEGVYQTLHVTDTMASTQTVFSEDLQQKPDSGISKYRYINLIPGSTIDLWFNDVKVASNIAYKQATDTFFLVTGTISQWKIRTAGSPLSATPLAQYPATTTNYTVPNQRVMTVYTRGYLGLTSTDPRRAMISLLYNK